MNIRDIDIGGTDATRQRVFDGVADYYDRKNIDEVTPRQIAIDFFERMRRGFSIGHFRQAVRDATTLGDSHVSRAGALFDRAIHNIAIYSDTSIPPVEGRGRGEFVYTVSNQFSGHFVFARTPKQFEKRNRRFKLWKGHAFRSDVQGPMLDVLEDDDTDVEFVRMLSI